MSFEVLEHPQVLQPPNYLVGPNGQPSAIVLELGTWNTIVNSLEDLEDEVLLKNAEADLEVLANGQRPAGWKTWDEFEAELDALEEAGELPT